jgi:hypothetical protein
MPWLEKNLVLLVIRVDFLDTAQMRAALKQQNPNA